MKNHDYSNDAAIDLGKASIETKGDAIFQTDGSQGRLEYVTGMADD
ncbi:MAG: hypothetical protein JJ901_03590 [Erythrobacter sp.]|nr:hypothetical protein [Erythrobacter sp.]MBO6767373.1 hypothetical protein [Erythrobacter sp.]